MLEELIRSPEQISIEECLSNPISNEILNFQYDSNIFEEPIINSQNNISTPSNNIIPLPLAAAETSPENYIATAFPFAATYSPYNSDDYISLLLRPPQPPPMISSADFMTGTPCSFIGGNGGIAGEFCGDAMGVAACGGDGELGYFAAGEGIGMAARMPESVENYGFEIYVPGTMQGVYGQGDLQVLGDGQHLMDVGCGGGAAPLQMPSDIASLDESSYKVGKLSVEERKEKIGRYLKKRNERNFSKKIKYACRKTLADSRPRVRGRFAKNEEFSEATRRTSPDNHEYNDMLMKNEEDMLQSSDILVHITGVNSFNYNYTLESWL